MMEFVTEMDDDFNAANGITVVYQLVKHLNRYLEEEVVSKEVISAYQETLEKLMLIFGIELASSEDLLDEDIDALIVERNTARKEKNFARSDEIRDLLKEQGIILEDTPQGTRWSRSE